MKLLLTGLSHKTAPVHLREKLALSEAAVPDALHELQHLGASEAMILSTCNRVEVLSRLHRDLEILSLADIFDATMTKAVEGRANGLALRIEDRRFEGYVYPSFHFAYFRKSKLAEQIGLQVGCFFNTPLRFLRR